MTEAKREIRRRAGPLLGWLREHKDEMAAFLAELVSIPTENQGLWRMHRPAGETFARVRLRLRAR